MTRRLLALLVATLVLGGVAATAPAPVVGAALPPHSSRAIPSPLVFDVRIGDGVFQLRIRGCHVCDIAVTVEIDLPPLFFGGPRPKS
jgi:hypothetical protein